MRRQVLVSLLVLLSVVGFARAADFSAFAFSGLAQEKSGLYKPGELIVRFSDTDRQQPAGVPIIGPRTKRAIRSAISDYVVSGATVHKECDRAVAGLAVVKLPEGTTVVDALIRFNRSANVLYAEPDYKYKFLVVPNDPNFRRQWALNNTGQTGGTRDADIDAPEAWDIQTGSSDIIVAVIDSGVDYRHPDLAGNMWTNTDEVGGIPGYDDDGNGYVDDVYGYDFLNDDNDPADDLFHGTHCAGVIGADTNNAKGVAGVCWDVSIMALKVGDSNGVDLAAAIEAIGYAAAMGARVINASWGGYNDSQGLKDAIAGARDAGVLFVAAAGNENNNNDQSPVYPANYNFDNIISVMATDHRDRRPSFSNYGAISVDIGAPGMNILSTLPTYETPDMNALGLPTSYGVMDGTSVSAPHVCGACALVWSHYPTMPYRVIKSLLFKTAEPKPSLTGLCLSGGRLNLQKALTLIPTGKLGKVLNTRDNPNDPSKLYATIQAAIDGANNGDTLIAEANSLFIETIDFKGKAITVRSGDIKHPSDPNISPKNTIILGILGDDSVVTFKSKEGSGTILKGFTISWGNADYGGGIGCDGASPTITDCIITDNFAAYFGGGVDCYRASPTIKNCTIINNETTTIAGVGGGINCEGGTPAISDCLVSNNFADNVGGGIACYYASPSIINCIIVNNSALYESGGIDLEYSSPTITNCTIVVDDANVPKFSGIFAYHDSKPKITNCILWGNGDDLYGCSAAYSCIEDDDFGVGNIHLDPLFVAGPLGDYYLSQTAAGQLANSPCVDAADPNTVVPLRIRLRTLTTRTDGITDSGRIDIGAHYVAVPAKHFTLKVTAVGGHGYVDPNSGNYRQYEVVRLKAHPDPNYRVKTWTGTDDDTSTEPNNTVTIIANTNVTIVFEPIPYYTLRTSVIGGHGTITPYHRRGQPYPEGTVVTLTATPDAGYIVQEWTGTDNDASWANTNTVTMDSDKDVAVSFRQPRALHVPGQYFSIQQAISAAYSHGDKIIVSAGTYSGNYVVNKTVTIASEHPDDPCCVAATIIRAGPQLPGMSGPPAFTFTGGQGRDAVIDGFTLMGMGDMGPIDPWSGDETQGVGISGPNDFGGAISCINGSGPTLAHLVIKDVVARGVRGQDAGFVFDPPDAPPDRLDPLDPNAPMPDPNVPMPDPNDPNAPVDGNDGLPGAPGLPGLPGRDGNPGRPGYHGGNGGNAYGGALYFDGNSDPLILNVTIINCHAIGGDGSFGGQGQNGQDGQDGQNGQAGQPGQNGAQGINNGTQGAGGDGGAGGNGGNGGQGGAGGRGGDGGSGGEALGGAVYFGPNCHPTIRYLKILNCSTKQGLGSYAGNGGNGGSGGDNGAGGNGGNGGSGSPGGAAGPAGVNGIGANGGRGGNGGDMGMNGARSWAGAIFYGENCQTNVSDSIISYNTSFTIAPTYSYAGGNAGNGGNGGNVGGNGGNGGNGGMGDPAGGRGTGGNGGQNGRNGANGADGADGSMFMMIYATGYGGGNYYDVNCAATLTNCTVSYNMSEEYYDGGGEDHKSLNKAILNRCNFTGNTGGYGGGQCFDRMSTVEVNDCNYTSNTAYLDGGGLYCSFDCSLDIKDSTFAGNSTLYDYSYGGGVCWEAGMMVGSEATVRRSYFVRNESPYGGGLHWDGQDSNVAIIESVINNNKANHGAGLYWSNGAPKITGCTVSGNKATGRSIPLDYVGYGSYAEELGLISFFGGGGGGMFCWSSAAEIESCFVSGNSASGSGGGVYFGGDPAAAVLRNCLVKGNSAVLDGGGIVSYWFAMPTISNCTIVDNKAYDPQDTNHGRGGGLSCSYESNTTLIDSILWGNTGTLGNQIAIGSNDDPVYISRPATLAVSYCDIQGGQSPQSIYIEPGRTLNWLSGNINTNPLFVLPYYYLSQTPGQPPPNSPCVNAGSDLAANLGLGNYTTRSDSINDTGKVDMGLHYPAITAGQYRLTVNVVGKHGTVQPMGGLFNKYTVVTLTATVDPGYRVRWIGSDDDLSNALVNTVTMYSDRTVTAIIEQPTTIKVPGDYPLIQAAVDAAKDGDVIVVNKGRYYGGGILVPGKAITITSTNPDDPCTVAATIIDGQGYVRPGIIFSGGCGPDTILNGLTIANCGWSVVTVVSPADPGQDGYDGGDTFGAGIYIEHGAGPTIVNCIVTDCYIRAGNASSGNAGGARGSLSDPADPGSVLAIGQKGGNGGNGGNVYGGGIWCGSYSSPIIRHCTISNCQVVGATAGNAGDGGGGGDGGVSGNGGNGGIGGGAYGGGIYVGANGRPRIEDCNIINCSATAGDAGDAGNGGAATGNGGVGGDGGVGGEAGRAYGGGIYFDRTAVATVSNCRFINCSTVAGDAGDGGDYGIAPTLWGLPGFGGGYLGEYWKNSAYGGGVYCGTENRVTFENCAFTGNTVEGGMSGVGGIGRATVWTMPRFAYVIPSYGAGVFCDTSSVSEFRGCEISHNYAADVNEPNGVPSYRLDPYISYGGGICYIDAESATITDCNFGGNFATLGGGLYWDNTDTVITDTNFVGNTAFKGGGIYSTDTLAATITRCIITDNQAVIPGGEGGGIHFASTPMLIEDSEIGYNYAAYSGGGVYASGSDSGPAELANCLITYNEAGRDGAGVSCNWYNEIVVSNCTITKNTLTGMDSYGAGLYCSYGSYAEIIDSIIWDNRASNGSQVAVASGDERYPTTSGLRVSYTDIGPRYEPNVFTVPIIIDSLEGDAPPSGPNMVLVDGQAIYSQFDAGQARVKVIVSMPQPVELMAVTDWDSPQSVARYRDEIADRQSAVLSTLTSDELTLRYRYQNQAGFAGEITRAGLEKLRSNPLVAHIEPVRYVEPALRQAIPLANALNARQVYDGRGVAIAIIDTGIDYTHPMLGGGGFPNSKVIGGYDTGENDPDPIPVGEAHGTCCAGIAAGNLGNVGDYIGGVAPGAKLYALKASPDYIGGFYDDALLAAWDWCVTHRNDNPKYPIKVMSNSWAFWGLPFDDHGRADAYSPAFTAAADTVVAVGITVLAASGNDGFPGYGITWPAAMSKVISVGAVNDTTDQVSWYSDTAEILDILAPGDWIYTTDIVGPAGYDPGNYDTAFAGTSAACPFAAGCVADIQSAARAKIGRYLTPAEVKSLLIATGDPVTDTKVAITRPRVNLGNAIGGFAGPPIYVEKGCELNGWEAPDTNNYWGWDPTRWPNSHNIEEDPNFISGYYLSQFATGQIIESNCVDGGSNLASALLDMDEYKYTTRIDGVNDVGVVDMGYHYRWGVPKYQIRVIVVEDLNDPGIHGTVEPSSGWYYEGTEVTLKAKANDDRHYLKGWYDVNGLLLSVEKNFKIVVDSNEVFIVRFRLPKKIQISGGGDAIKRAISTAENGDTLIVASGTYDGDINFQGKDLKMFSTNPDDPNVVARTIIDCQANGRGFTFSPGADADTVVNGFTIINGSTFDQPGGAIYIDSNSSPIIANVIINNCEALIDDGGAIFVDTNSSPRFRNVTINNCTTFLGNGGGVWVGANSVATFVGCTITNCGAVGGSGGAVYGNTGSYTEFADCEFSGNGASFDGGGLCHGVGSESRVDRCVFADNIAFGGGGGICYTMDCVAEVNDCNFVGNSVAENGGGILCYLNNSITVTDCNFADNLAGYGGGIYFDPNCRGAIAETVLVRNDADEDGGAIYLTEANGLSIADCNVSFNVALRGAGLFCIDSVESTITGCIIRYNEAHRLIAQYPNPIEDDTVTSQGGGIFAFEGPKLIANCDISHNRAKTSGGGIYLAGDSAVDIKNCLVTSNSAGRDGAGISANWQSEPNISNCTIADNTLTTIFSYGGGLYGSYDSNSVVTDSIIWNNSGTNGSQIAVCSGDPAYPLPSNLKVTYSDVDLRIVGAAEAGRFINPDELPIIRPGFNTYTLPGNDDGSTGLVNIGFPANYFGIVRSNLYVNNNGNITFDTPLMAFTPFGLTTNIGTAIIAPFFADVDTRASSIVSYGPGNVNGRPAFGVNWINVGYFFMNIDKLNSFQLILIDRSDRALGDFDIELNYGAVNWETGDASGGINGFGGFSAHAGFSNGTGLAGTFYEFPGSGVPGSFLDSSSTGLVHDSRNSSVLGRYIFSVRGGTLDVAYGVPIYVEEGCRLEGWEPNDPNFPLDPNAPAPPWLPNTYNIHDDPNFVPGPLGEYYLSQIGAGHLQLIDSSCIDMGSKLAGALGMDKLTTRTDLRPDAKIVDLGYHYPLRGPKCKLVLIVVGSGTVVADPNGWLDPNNPLYNPSNNVYTYKQYKNAIVKLTAIPAEGYRVKSWNGTDNDPSWNRNTNMVTLDGDKVVRVEFEKAITDNIFVPAEYPTIEEAIATAGQGDTNIIVNRGIHYVNDPDGIDFQGKSITLMSTDPEDPNVVATTIIDAQGSVSYPKRAFHFHSGEDPNAVITGLTIRNGYIRGPLGQAGRFGVIQPDPYEVVAPLLWPPPDARPRAERGTNATGSAYGGGILCENGSSPTFRNCVITNCIVTGAHGGAGANGWSTTPSPPWPGQWSYIVPGQTEIRQTNDGQWGGIGADGSGNGYGGAMACLNGSKPILIGCTLRDNSALGGIGGNGGNGGNSGGGYESWGGDGGVALGDGRGGAIYCDNQSLPIIRDCNFINNIARTGPSGNGGARGTGNQLPVPYGPADAGIPGVIISAGRLGGGAVYYAAQTGADIAYSNFTGNQAFEGYIGIDIYGNIGAINVDAKGAAVYVEPANTANIVNCRFNENLGGAVFVESRSIVDVNNCLFKDNRITSRSFASGYYGPIDYETGGGAIYIGPDCNGVSIRDTSFYGNSAFYDGGAVNCTSDANFINCAFGGNEASRNGGAIDAFYNHVTDPNIITTLELNFETCSFAGNRATEGINGWGGAVHFQDFNALFTNCYFLNNTARNGGALFLSSGTVNMIGGIMHGNKAIGGSGIDMNRGVSYAPYYYLGGPGGNWGFVGYGSYYYTPYSYGAFYNVYYGVGELPDMSTCVDIGGGAVLADTHGRIENFTITDNVVEGLHGSGGAINFFGGYVDHVLKNCLITGNSASVEGGAISANSFATPQIQNCTFGNNDAGDLGGAIFCDWSSAPVVSDSIFQSCNSHAIAEEDFGDAIVRYCLFHNNQNGDYGVYDNVTQKTSTLAGRDLDVTNIAGDPLFVSGPLDPCDGYYLSQTPYQSRNSPAFNYGSTQARNLGMDKYTTCTSGVTDTGIVDIGYHYADHRALPRFNLTATVIGGHGRVEPTSGTYYAGMLVPITAIPEAGYRVAGWAGTLDDTSRARANAIVMSSDRDIAVWFDQLRTIVVGSDPNYTSIQHAIDAAVAGDVVIIPTGTYTPAYPFMGIRIIRVNKGITLTSTNPDDPACVSATVLSTYRIVVTTLGSEAIIEGITIRSGGIDIYSCSPTVRNCIFTECNIQGADGGNPTVIPDDGQNGDGLVGGAMVIYNGSPAVQNCSFTDCSVTGGDGGPGDNGVAAHPVGFDGGWAGWAYGGAAYIGYSSNPTFTDCNFVNCYALGGNGGNAGNGTNAAPGGRGGNWEWAPSIETGPFTYPYWSWWDGWQYAPYEADGSPRTYTTNYGYFKDYWRYSGYGGAVYIEADSAPKFINCLFRDNRTYGGVCGIGGVPVIESQVPDRNLDIENFGGTIYACNGSNPEFVNCTITNSSADTNTVTIPDDIMVSYGGAVAFEDDCGPKFTNCTITDSNACIGGAMYWSNSTVTIVDCNIAGSNAYHGGGLYSVDSTGIITGSIITRNRAVRELVPEPNDPNAPIPFDTGIIFGQGGGYYCLSSIVDITDSIFTDNVATGSGGAIYYGGSDQQLAFAPLLHNCLITGNIAARDGGGISVNWGAEPTISDCTIADNEVTGAIGYGGGLYCSYDSNATVVDSIIWGNIGMDGSQIAVGSGDKYGPRPSRVNVTYSDVQPEPDPNLIQRPTKLDVVFCIDTTASMWDDIDAVKVAATEIINQIAAKSPDFRIAVVDYRDFPRVPYGDPNIDYPYHDALGFETNPAMVRAGINSLNLGFGLDWRESVYSALMHCIDGSSFGGWRSGSDVSRIIILIGDAPPHDPEPTTGYRLADVVAAAMAGEPKNIFAIPVDGNPITTAYFSGLAEGTGGAIIEAANAAEVVDAVMGAIQLIGKPPKSIYVENGCTLDWWNADSNSWDPASHNIDEDPLFVANYYLSQTASGQLVNSSCVDVGSADVNDPDVRLSTYTTRTDGVNDAGIVNMGYHHTAGLTGYRLTVTVIEDPNDHRIHGYVNPNNVVVYEGYGSNVVTLTAVPDVGYKVKKWTGTDNDTSVNRINTVTMTRDKDVAIEFEPAPLYRFTAYVIDRGNGPHGIVEPNSGSFYDGETITLTAAPDPNYQVRAWYGTDNDASKEPNNTVTIRGSNAFVAVEFGLSGQGIINLYTASGALDRRSPFLTIQAAINAAGSNYSVVVSDGIYTGAGNYNIDLKAGLDPNVFRPITVRSENGPNDCIIDCQGLGRAFIFDANEDPNYVVDGFTITGGFAGFGGAMLIDSASPLITNCKIINNRATGDGGAIYCTNASPRITNTEISSNTAGGFGGGIYCQNTSAPRIINCLITLNTSGDIGGSIYLYNSPAIITLCTIAYNDGLDYGDGGLYPNPKGGICCRDSTPTITNCIIGRSGGMWGVWGDLFSAGDDLYNCTATYSCIENSDDGDGNIDGDPLWTSGPLGNFYLSQIMSGQAQTSPCINAGEQYVLANLQAAYNLGAITTSIMNYPDVGYADMGYHYRFFTGPPIQYKLEIFVVGHGTVEPNQWPEVNYYAPGTLVSLKAIPDPNYRVRRWTGTDNDTSASMLNSVTMYSNRTVTVEFEPAVKRILNVSTDGRYTYMGLQQAIDDAREGDMVVLHSGRYAGTGFTVMGKNITITGTNPDDPNVVASTVIDCTGEIQGGIHLIGAPGGRCVLNGITIMNSHPGTIDSPGPQGDGARGIDGADSLPYAYMETAEGAFTGTGYIYSDSALTVIGNHIVSNCIITNCSVSGGDASGGNQGADDQDGGNGGNGGSAGAAGIYIGDVFEYYYDYPEDMNDPNWWEYYEPVLLRWGSSPTVRNCIINNCVATAGNGGNGATGGARASGGNGGVSGRAMGGGIYCDVGTNPTFINCIVTNCQVVSGNGGNGGNGGAEAGAGGFGGLTYADPCQPDPELFSAYGAGVYCGMMSKPAFIDCVLGNNVSDGSVSGVGGFSVPSGVQRQPRRNYDIPSYGAGIYCDSGCSAAFENCTMENNRTTYHNGVYSGYGGGVCFDGSKADYSYEDYYLTYPYSYGYSYYLYYLLDGNTPGPVSAILTDCIIANNSASVGGGLYGVASTLNIVDCNLTGNSSYVGGGLCATDSTATICGCAVQRNIASPAADPNLPPNDPNSMFRFGAGAGIYCFSTDTVIRDCDIAHNIASGSGGGVYLFGESNSPKIVNCLVTNNLAGRDGGGVSVNWYAEPNIANCTFVGNAATGSFGSSTGVGGGLYSSYGSSCIVRDCIFWNNYALKGDGIAVGTGFEYDMRPAKLTVKYSDVKGGRPGIQVDNGCTLLPNANDWLLKGPGKGNNIDTDPLFVAGMFGDYYLSQTDVGDPNQTKTSPCVDVGSDYANNLGMIRYTDPTGEIIGYTTRTDGELERGVVDMGYHYRTVEPCRFCDLVYDGVINFYDFAKLASSWLHQGCSDADGWCHGADVTFDRSVGIEDLAFFAECWLVADTEAPIPDPSEWEIEPYLVSSSSIKMIARTAFDAWGWDVEYYFDCVYGSCHDSVWQKSVTYQDTGLKTDTRYGYRVKARDEIGNETEWSVIRYAGVLDTTPPAPAPTWAVAPYPLPDPLGQTQIAMVATTAYDDSGVTYGFWNVTNDPAGNNVVWQPGQQFIDVNLDPNTTYGYRVMARDNSVNKNETAWSVKAYATTLPAPDITPPTPDPAAWDLTTDANGYNGRPLKFNRGGGSLDYWATMRAVQAVDPSGVEYRFVCDNDLNFSSQWQSQPANPTPWIYTRPLGGVHVETTWYVIVRDRYGNETVRSETWPAHLRAPP